MNLAHCFAAVTALWQQPPDAPITNAFNHPATAEAVRGVALTWHALFFFLPFILTAELLLLYVIFKFRDKGDGRRPATFHENGLLEFAWTVIPAIVVLYVGLHQLGTLRFMEYGGSNAALNVEVVGHQFFWEYKYPQYGIDISNATLVVPSGQTVDLDLTSVDVIHGWYVPSLGIQEDALPGRVTNLWFKADPGNYKGQCTQLCGVNHGQMLIDVSAVSPEQFQQWVATHRNATPQPKAIMPNAPAGPAKGGPQNPPIKAPGSGATPQSTMDKMEKMQ